MPDPVSPVDGTALDLDAALRTIEGAIPTTRPEVFRALNGIYDEAVRLRADRDRLAAQVQAVERAMRTTDLDAMLAALAGPPAPKKTPAPSVDDLVGIDPGWTGDLTTDEYVDRQRADEEAL